MFLYTVQEPPPFNEGSIWPSSRSGTPLQQRAENQSLNLTINQHKTNSKTASIHPIHQLPPLLPSSTSNTDCAWRKQIHLTVSGGQTGFRMGSVRKNVMGPGAKFSDILRMAALGSWCGRAQTQRRKRGFYRLCCAPLGGKQAAQRGS